MCIHAPAILCRCSKILFSRVEEKPIGEVVEVLGFAIAVSLVEKTGLEKYLF